jgi:hypothetical protein
MKLLTTLVFVVLGLVALEADAACVCRCVNGEVKPLCEKAIDLPPICSPTICPIVPPKIAPIEPPTVPPIGTTQCRQEQILNPVTKQYEWRRVCK